MNILRWALPVKTGRKRGFTIVELVVVIVIIAILAAITTVSYTAIQAQARGTAMITDFKNIDEAMRLWGIRKGLATWPRDNDAALTGVSNPKINDILANTSNGLSAFLDPIDAAKSSGVPGMYYYYDNDNDTYGGCAHSDTMGVNIYVSGQVPENIARYIEDNMDDGNFDCGMVTYNSSTKQLRVVMSKGQPL